MRGLVLSSAACEAGCRPGQAGPLPLQYVGSDYQVTVKLWKLLALSSIVSQSRAAVGNKAARVVLQAILGDP